MDYDDFFLPESTAKNSIKCLVYYFNSPWKTSINISWGTIAKDVIRHLMSVYKWNYGTVQPLWYPNNPDAYELRLTDDDEEVYTPNREIAALDRNSPLE